MTDPAKEVSARAAALERSMRNIKRNIVGVANVNLDTISEAEADIFEARLTSAKEHWKEFQTAWNERELIQTKLGASDTFPSEAWYQLHDSLRDEIIKASGAFLTIQKREMRRNNQQSAPNANSTANQTGLYPFKPQLPRIPIPTFSGDLLRWNHFRDTFISMIHNEPSISNVEKFHYLIGSLKGEAAALISKFPIEERMYAQAWEKVVETYDDPRVLANLLVHRMVDCDIKSVKGELQRYDAFLTGVADSIDCFRGLNLKDPMEFVLATIALRALDPETRRQFELSLKSSRDFPTADTVVDFIRQRKRALMMSHKVYSDSDSNYSSSSRPSRNVSLKHSSVSLYSGSSAGQSSQKSNNSSKDNTTSQSKSDGAHKDESCNKGKIPRCLHCEREHLLPQCTTFRDLPTAKRTELVRTWKVCFNCLRKGHRVTNCSSRFRCRSCNGKHHSLIHKEDNIAAVRKDVVEDNTAATPETFIGFGSKPIVPEANNSMVLLGTVRALVKGSHGEFYLVRAVLDSGSQHTFISSALARKISGKISPFKISIASVADSSVPQSRILGSVPCVICPCGRDEEYKVSSIVVDRVTPSLPTCDMPTSIIDKLKRYPLADSKFGESGPVDLLIGGDIDPYISTGTPYHSGVENLVLSPTVFGLVVKGVVQNLTPSTSVSFFSLSKPDIEAQLRAFWEVEEPAPVDRSHPDDVWCEEHFKRTHSRSPDGRYIVRLPFKPEHPEVGSNRDAAFRRFHSLESKFKRNPLLDQEYHKFMKDYSDLGHMSPSEAASPYIIPHHGVWQERPDGSKLRVVFDASCPSSTQSLNDLLLPGPNLQEDLSTVLTRFRMYPVAICADIVKMYRQILMHPEDRRHQHVLWRDDTSKPIQEMELNTVTYGVKSSSYQALRVLRQLVKDEGSPYPLASIRVLQDMYVDDLVTGAETVDEAHIVIEELCAMFAKGGFNLSKWASNVPQLLNSVDHHVDAVSIQHPIHDSVKILGLFWNPSSDSFSYAVMKPPSDSVTKRVMLSSVAKIFDPLGFLAPIILTAKSLIQEVWKADLGWDDELPGELSKAWGELVADWELLSLISIPRYTFNLHAKLQLVGFCDASCKGYAAALYLRSEDIKGDVKISLVKAKTKVAPLKYLSIARLELCGALLLSRLVSSVYIPFAETAICFTDSQVVLSWLNTPTHALQVFEANRVSQILNFVPMNLWRHVSSEDNPADVASRGCLPKELKEKGIWWHGPPWLESPVAQWFTPANETITMSAYSSERIEPDVVDDWTARFSSFRTLVRTVARIIRVFARVRSPSQHDQISSGPISAKEFREAELRCIRFVQRTFLPKELFKSSSSVPHAYAQLSPFLDEWEIVRVGGRLQESPLDYSARHPILLPRQSPFARLVIDHIHTSHFHAGPSLTLALLRGRYWVTSAARVVRGQILRCVHCRLLKAKPATPFMAPLPKGRFSQTRPFIQVGIDYAGPFFIKESRRRNASLGKAYLCLFVCMSTKALHLEVVSALTTPAFMMTLERFMSRRGRPSTIWSDHGTNFVGASRVLKEIFRFQKENEHSITEHLASQGIEWKFIPPRAPHFGGLWEAGVKSVKNLLTSSLGSHPYTFEELTTAFSKIEALLNSRPLCPLAEDVNSFDTLTPGHFLIGAPLMSLPEPSECGISRSLWSKWRTMQEQVGHVWDRWRREYLNTLQVRTKWTRKVPGLKIGDLVVLLERRSQVGLWPVGRIVETFPGRDGITRTVSVRTPSGNCLTRASTSLVPLFPPE